MTGGNGRAVFVSEKLAAPEAAGHVAVTVNAPVRVFAVNVTLATPREFVTAVIVVRLLLKRPVGPELGVTKVTVAPTSGTSVLL